MNEIVLKLKDITKSFEKVKAVDNVSFEVCRGEILGLLGPNGAGKTTVIRMIMGIFEPDSGLLEFDSGKRINKKRVGYLPEERGVYDDTRLLETIKYFAVLKGMNSNTAEKETLKWLEKLNLKEFADSKIEELSKGMQQKVQFIISIIHKPDLVVLDEVFSGLDPVNQDLFKSIIRELSAEGITVLLSSHRMNMVEELCDRIFMINRGKQVLYGKIDKIKDDFGIKQVKLRADFNGSFSSDMTPKKREGKNMIFNIPLQMTPQEFLEKLPEALVVEELFIQKPPLHDIFVSEAQRSEVS